MLLGFHHTLQVMHLTKHQLLSSFFCSRVLLSLHRLPSWNQTLMFVFGIFLFFFSFTSPETLPLLIFFSSSQLIHVLYIFKVSPIQISSFITLRWPPLLLCKTFLHLLKNDCINKYCIYSRNDIFLYENVLEDPNTG